MYNSVRKQQIRKQQVEMIRSLDLKNPTAFIVPYFGLTDISEITLPSGIATENCIGVVKDLKGQDVAGYANRNGVRTYNETFSSYCQDTIFMDGKFNVAIIDYHFMATDKTISDLKKFMQKRITTPAFVSINWYTPRDRLCYANYSRALEWAQEKNYESRLIYTGNTRNYCLQAITLKLIEESGLQAELCLAEHYRVESSPSIMHIIGCKLTDQSLQIGNTVPASLAKALAISVKKTVTA